MYRGPIDIRTPGDPIRVATADGPAWVVRRRADVVAALSSPQLSACPRHARGDDYRGYDLPPAFRENIISAEPDDHRRLRRLIAPRMDEAAARRARPLFRAAAETTLAELPERFDLVRDFAGPYVAAATAAWLGLAEPLRERYLAWAGDLLRSERGRDTLPAMVALVEDIDLALGPMSPGETSAMTFYLLFVWYEICVNAVAAALLTGDPDEALRRHTPQTTAFRRFAIEDLGDIEQGQTVLLSLAAASADSPGGHVAFGHGPHRCPGQAIALAMMREAITAGKGGIEVRTVHARWVAGLRTYGPRDIEGRKRAV
ncbi:hypothetical protein [Dactylosporangium sp. CS-033363]|uniref:hypothetical protein n=1 Tax=Dactylosporangium sp. CS-033363 TaxID=3239935 RepID=UPI003D8ECF0E